MERRILESELTDLEKAMTEQESLEDAAKKAGYHSMSSAALQITNVPEDRDVERIAGASRGCRTRRP